MGLIEDLGAGPVALDTCVFIYFMEEHGRYLKIVKPVFEAIDQGRFLAVTSSLTLLETLALPYRQGNIQLVQDYQSILTNSKGLEMVDLSHTVLHIAASLRARTNIRTPDSLQIASAIQCKCSVFLTNDLRLPDKIGLPVVQLRDYCE